MFDRMSLSEVYCATTVTRGHKKRAHPTNYKLTTNHFLQNFSPRPRCLLRDSAPLAAQDLLGHGYRNLLRHHRWCVRDVIGVSQQQLQAVFTLGQLEVVLRLPPAKVYIVVRGRDGLVQRR